GPRGIEIATQALDKPVDKFLDYALWLTARESEPQWLPLVQKGQLDFGGDVRHLVFALQALDSKDALRPLVDLVRSGKVPAERQEGVLTVIAGMGGPNELGLILDGIVKEKGPGARQANLLAALTRAARERNVRPAGELARVGQLLESDNDAVRA